MKDKETEHISPALEVLDLIGRKLAAGEKRISIKELWSDRSDLSSEDLTDGMRILIERGVIDLRPGDDGESDLSIGDDDK